MASLQFVVLVLAAFAAVVITAERREVRAAPAVADKDLETDNTYGLGYAYPYPGVYAGPYYAGRTGFLGGYYPGFHGHLGYYGGYHTYPFYA